MVDADHAQGRALRTGRQGDRHSRLVESGGDIVNGDGVVGVGTVKGVTLAYPNAIARVPGYLRIGADVANNRQRPVGRGQGLDVDKRRDLGRQVNAVDEDVGILDNFLERTTLLGLLHIPLNDVGLGNTNILGQLNSTLTATTQL